MENLIVTILAAGEGKRMNSNLPKVLHTIKNRPMLVRVIETARLLNPVKLIVVVGKHKDLIQTTLSKYFSLNDIIFVEQPEALGTGDAIKSCLQQYADDGPVLILNGDMPLITLDILKKMTDSEYDASVMTAKFENPSGYGRVFTTKKGMVLKIVEEKDCTDIEKENNIINTGIYCIHSIFLKEFIPKIEKENAQKEYYLTDIIKFMNQRFIPVQSILLDENENIFVSGVNTPEELANLVNYAS
jgi:bifunctional UDP-N-acetylglucosamine pyrophosphorylase/glucosamine-1-phosphate N-acetyltransferase